MKKVLLLLVLLLLPFSVYANEKIQVEFSKCVDGDTAKVILKKKEVTIRFLAIDTPESKHPTKGTEPFGKESSEYTCKRLTNAKKIEIQYDPKSDKEDKYDRQLVWVFVNDRLIQKELLSKGYAKLAYLYGDYMYTKDLEKVELKAKESKVGIWSDTVEDSETNLDKNTIIDMIIDFIKDIFDKILKFLRKLLNNML